MDAKDKLKKTNQNKKEDNRFQKKNIKHDPNAESARAVFGKEK